MTADELKQAIAALATRQTEQIVRGAITPEEASIEQVQLLMRATLEMADDDLNEVSRWMLTQHQMIADMLADRGRPIPGNDRDKPN
jgi:hypothetical protein